MPVVTNGTCRIYWRGDGDPTLPALVLGNSLGTDFSLWDPILNDLMRDFYVIRYDSRGHGGSDAPQGDYTISQLTDDVQAVIAAARLTSYSYWGISMGGMVGMELAARHAPGLKRIVLSNTSVEFDNTVWIQRIAAIKQGGMAAVVDAVIGRFFTPEFVAANSLAVRRMRNAILSHAPNGYNGCCAAIRDMDLLPRLPMIQVPTLVVVGEFDQSTPPERGEKLVANIAGAKLVALPCAHIPVTEIPDKYLQAVVPFLKS